MGVAGFLSVLALVFFLASLPVPAVGREEAEGSLIVVGRVSGVVSGAVLDYVRQLVDYAESVNASLLVIEVDTPGGSLEATLSIVGVLHSARVPVASLVVGRWAMSAGTIIVECSDYAAMQPLTLIGAVQPVELTTSGGYKPVNESKVLNPVYKEIEVCMRMSGRNYTVARLFVYQNLVLSASEAYRMRVVDGIASGPLELASMLNNSFVPRLNKTLILTPPLRVKYYTVPPGLVLAQLLSDPLVSSMIASMAMLVIILGLATGHPLVAVLGIGLFAISLFGLGLSASLVATALLLIGLLLLAIELAIIPGFGVTGVTGLLLMMIGLTVVFTGKPIYITGEVMRRALHMLIAAILPPTALFMIIVYKAVKVWKKKPIYHPVPKEAQGRAMERIEPGKEGFIIVEGEYWRARNIGERTIEEGEKVRVKGKEGPLLLVEPIEQ